MRTVPGGGKVVWTFWAAAGIAALSAGGGCSGGPPTITPLYPFDGGVDATPDTPAVPSDVPAATGDAAASDAPAADAPPGPATVAPSGPPVDLMLDTPLPMDPGNHCGRTVVYFDAGHTGSYGLDLGPGGTVHATSGTLTMLNASFYCTFTLPVGTKSLVFHHGVANIKIDPTNMYPNANGGGLGFMIYLGTNTPAAGVTWGDYGKPTVARWKQTRPDWNGDLPPEDDSVVLSAAATTATFAVYLVDAWGNLPVDGDVVSTAVEARSTP